ncbi:MAG: hypothetical protein ACRYFY_22900 [Janthinobacterium lividum]
MAAPMNSSEYQNVVTAIRKCVAVKNGYSYTRHTPGKQLFSFSVYARHPAYRLEIVYDTSLYIVGYIIDNHGYKFRDNPAGNFTTEAGIRITNHSTLDVKNVYTDGFRSASQDINVIEIDRILKDLTKSLSPGNNVKFSHNDHQKLFVAFAEAVRFGDILRDIVRGVALTGLTTRLNWNARSSANDPSVAVA